MNTEHWEVEKLTWNGWVHDTDENPRFDNYHDAYMWASKLTVIHQAVRVKHVVAEYEVIQQAGNGC